MYIETHCHLDYLKQDTTAQLLSMAKEQGIEKCVTIAVTPENFDAVEQLTQEYDQVHGTLGVHPHEAMKVNDTVLNDLKTRIPRNPKIVAVGEIGLDYHYDHAPRHIQRKVFEKQIQLSLDLDLPMVIHTREAEKDTMAILKNFETELKKKVPGVLHSFTSSQELANHAWDLGFYMGFNGIITFKNAHDVRDVLKKCPLDRLIYETDSPFLTPAPNRGKENAPHYLPFVAQKCAEVKEMDQEALDTIVLQNSIDLFNLAL